MARRVRLKTQNRGGFLECVAGGPAVLPYDSGWAIVRKYEADRPVAGVVSGGRWKKSPLRTRTGIGLRRESYGRQQWPENPRRLAAKRAALGRQNRFCRLKHTARDRVGARGEKPEKDWRLRFGLNRMN